MPRHNRRASAPPPAAGTRTNEVREQWRGEDYVVRTVPGASATKAYRCPGCDQEVRPGVAHLVAWRTADLEAGDRRHWHAGCWRARESRAPTRRL